MWGKPWPDENIFARNRKNYFHVRYGLGGNKKYERNPSENFHKSNMTVVLSGLLKPGWEVAGEGIEQQQCSISTVGGFRFLDLFVSKGENLSC